MRGLCVGACVCAGMIWNNSNKPQKQDYKRIEHDQLTAVHTDVLVAVVMTPGLSVQIRMLMIVKLVPDSK